MQSRLDEFHAAGFQVLGISVDSVEKNAEVATKHAITFPLLSDPELKAIDAFGLRHSDGGFGQDIARPAVFLIDRQGRIVWRRMTDDWRVRLRPEDLLQAISDLTP